MLKEGTDAERGALSEGVTAGMADGDRLIFRTMTAYTRDEVRDLCLDMIEVDHPPLDVGKIRRKPSGGIVLPTLMAETEPSYEWWSDEPGAGDNLRGLSVYLARAADLIVDKVESYVLKGRYSTGYLNGMDCIERKDHCEIVIDCMFCQLRAKVRSVKIVLQVYSEPVELITVYEESDGLQTVSRGAQALAEAAAELGIDPSEIQQLVREVSGALRSPSPSTGEGRGEGDSP